MTRKVLWFLAPALLAFLATLGCVRLLGPEVSEASPSAGPELPVAVPRPHQAALPTGGPSSPDAEALEAERRHLAELAAMLEGADIPWDTSVPARLHPDAIAARFRRYEAQGVVVRELRCAGYPCVVVAEHPPDVDLVNQVVQELEDAGDGDLAGGTTFDDPIGGRRISVIAVAGSDLPRDDPHVAGEVMATLLEYTEPILPDAPDAARPVSLGSGWR